MLTNVVKRIDLAKHQNYILYKTSTCSLPGMHNGLLLHIGAVLLEIISAWAYSSNTGSLGHSGTRGTAGEKRLQLSSLPSVSYHELPRQPHLWLIAMQSPLENSPSRAGFDWTVKCANGATLVFCAACCVILERVGLTGCPTRSGAQRVFSAGSRERTPTPADAQHSPNFPPQLQEPCPPASNSGS